MKKLLGLLSIAVIGLTSCNNQQTADNSQTVDTKVEAKKLNDLLDKYAEPSQTFSVSADSPSKVKGKQGTVISVNPSDLVTESGQPLGKNIDVELKELTNQEQLLKSNVQTVSDGQLLVSDGAYYINITSNGQQLKLKEGENLKIQFPKLSDNEMSLFYGQRDSSGKINWKQADQTFLTPTTKTPPTANKRIKSYWESDTLKTKSEMITLLKYIVMDSTSKPMTKEEKEKYRREWELEKKLYEPINIGKFGWINCDRFLDNPNITDLYVQCTPSDSIFYANTYLVFKDINSVMEGAYGGNSWKTAKYGFSNIPIGYKVKLIAYTIKDEKVYSYSSDLIVAPKQTMTLVFKETNEQGFKKLLSN